MSESHVVAGRRTLADHGQPFPPADHLEVHETALNLDRWQHDVTMIGIHLHSPSLVRHIVPPRQVPPSVGT
ncbi:hypothetical protein [Dactylosporangium sp. NPDC006015]|uniref:hypothetical protein n=1 Tax=Dactylosporangium sp. NPDC006015 TaxID=3154576 RepID=UPI0033B84075